MEYNQGKQVRPSWDEYFMEIMRAVSRRGTCDRGMTAVVLVRDKQILVTGYVGSPIGLPHCDEVGHQMKKTTHEDGSESNHCVRTNHAEVNAVAQAARRGIPIDGATMYCKMAPCYNCAKMLINTGIKRIVAERHYHQGQEAVDLLKRGGIIFNVLNEEIEEYSNQ